MPRLGILITYFNEGETLTRTLHSLGEQKGIDEILLYDDFSTLRPEPFIPAGMKVHVIRGEKNRGPAFGRNRLLDATQSEFIHFHDADDLFAPSWSQAILETISREKPDAIFTEVSVRENGKLVDGAVQGLRVLSGRDEWVAFCLRYPLLTSAGTFRTRLIRTIGGYRKELWQSEDYDFHTRVAFHSSRTIAIPEALIQRTRIAGRSAERYEVWSCALEAIEYLANELPGRFLPDLAEAAARAGSQLFRMGATEDARRAFRLARTLGPPRCEQERTLYQWIARIAGQEIAEWMGWAYRCLKP